MKQKAKKKVFIDFEFTGLDNYLNDNNEVIAMSIKIEDKPLIFKVYSSEKENTVGSFLKNQITKEMQEGQPRYSSQEILNICWVQDSYELAEKYVFYWYWISTDKEKGFYWIDIYSSELEYIDIQETLHTNKKFAKDLIIHWDALDVVSVLLLNKPSPSHWNGEEIERIIDLYNLLEQPEIKKEQTHLYMYVPYGFAKGKEIEEFCYDNRNSADWIRYNNDNLYAMTLNFYCNKIDYQNYYDDEDEEYRISNF